MKAPPLRSIQLFKINFMSGYDKVVENSDSLIEILAAQCADLEKLLSLAREETLAAEQGNFLSILDIVSEREKIGRQLETFQQRTSELRRALGTAEKSASRSEIASRIVETARLTIEQDQKTRLLLNGAREEAAEELKNLEKSHRGTNVYLRAETKGLAYNRKF